MSYVDSKLSAGLIDSGLDMLIVSLDGISAETYESIRVGARFKETIGNIESFLTLKQKGKRPFVTVQMIYINKTQKEAGVFINLWKNKVDSVRIRPYENVDRDKDYLYAVPLKPQSDYRPCIQLWRGLVVYWDGTVVPCCFDYDKFEVLGNLERDSLRQIWNSEKMIYLRQKHIMGHRLDIPLCKECHPFEPSTLLIVGGIFLNPLTSRKVLHHLERILIFKGIELFKY
jgi:radical SAM protein with 4Fe4S-binding SPASM domain